MGEITIDEIDRTIVLLKMRARDQARLLADPKLAPTLRPAHANLVANIYRMVCIRDGLLVDEPTGLIH